MMRQYNGDDWLVLQTSINWKLLRGRKGELSPCLSYISIPTFHLEPCPSYLWVWNKFMLDNRVKVFSIKNHFMPQEGAPLILWWWFQKQTRRQGGKPPAGGVLPSHLRWKWATFLFLLFSLFHSGSHGENIEWRVTFLFLLRYVDCCASIIRSHLARFCEC